MQREYAKGNVQKDKGEWKAVLDYYEGGRRARITKRTGIRCFPGKDDRRGKQKALDFLRQWRDSLVALVVIEDGTLTEAGKKRCSNDVNQAFKSLA